jgi:predicted HD phosphohydrolase
MTHAKHIDDLLDLLSAQGKEAYFGEPVSILEHCLQCAHFAEQSHASPATITAALLHDIGHVLHGLPEDIAQYGVDGAHENVAAAYLSNWFSNRSNVSRSPVTVFHRKSANPGRHHERRRSRSIRGTPKRQRRSATSPLG